MSTSHAPLGPVVASVVAGLLGPSSALASELVVSPLLGDATVDVEDLFRVHQVLASELDFAPEVERVIELTAVPEGLNDWCLLSSRCLQGLATKHEGDAIVAGRIVSKGSDFVLDLVLFDEGEIVRRQAFTVPQDPTGLSNRMTSVIRELFTGIDPRKEQAAAMRPEDFAGTDDVELESESAQVVAPAPAPADEIVPEDEADTITFGAVSKEEIRVAELAEPDGIVGGVVEGSPAEPEPTPQAAPTPQPVVAVLPPRPAPAPPAEPEPRPAPDTRVDESAERGRSEPVRRSSSTAQVGRPNERPPRFRIAARGGYSRYYSFDFITGGIEASARVSPHLDLVAGLEMYAVNRVLPPDLQIQEGVYSEWNVIFPANVGALFRIDVGNLQPYLGADLILVQYYRDDIGGDWAGGARARVGLDYMVIDNFGLNLNVAAGAWTGQNWGLIEEGVGQTGFLPQISAGTVFAF